MIDLEDRPDVEPPEERDYPSVLICRACDAEFLVGQSCLCGEPEPVETP